MINFVSRAALIIITAPFYVRGVVIHLFTGDATDLRDHLASFSAAWNAEFPKENPHA